MRDLASDSNILCVAGGTGITYVLPVLLDIASRPQNRDRKLSLVWVIRHRSDINWVAPELAILKRKCRNLRTGIHIYVTRAAEDHYHEPNVPTEAEKVTATDCSPEGGNCCGTQGVESCCAPKEIGVQPKSCCQPKEIQAISNSVSNSSSASVSSALSVHGVSKSELNLDHIQARPDLSSIVQDFVASTVRGRTDVFASGPGGMISDLRAIIAGANKGSAVWRGEERGDVRLTCDDRLEW